jgi:hypothetical protein
MLINFQHEPANDLLHEMFNSLRPDEQERFRDRVKLISEQLSHPVDETLHETVICSVGSDSAIELSKLSKALENACSRMDRARRILTNNS